jgi:tRNA (guanosine-2'-O-)-methyltransferase
MNSKEQIEILREFVLPDRYARLAAAAARRTTNLTIVLDRIHHDHNISAVVRSADAFGVQQIHLVGESFQKCSDISLGAERWLEIESHPSIDGAVRVLRAAGYKLAMLHPRDEAASIPSLPVYSLPFQEKLALVFGNEKEGLSDEWKQHADLFGFIPMFGLVESFNVSVAAAITLFCSTISGAEGLRHPAPINETEQESLLAMWLAKDVRAAEKILKRVEEKVRV